MPVEKVVEAEVINEEQDQDISDLTPVVSYDNERSIFITNIPEMKEALKSGLALFDYEVTEDTKDDAKADRTKLNALEKEITETRKAYAERFNKWKPIEKSMMELEKLVRSASDKLKRGIDALNLKAEQEKIASIKAYWDSLQTGIDYPLVHNLKYKNQEYTEKKWKADLDSKAAQITKERDFVKAMLDAKKEFNETERQQVFAIYNRTINQSEALNRIVEIDEAKAQEKALEEERKIIEAQRAEEEAYKQRIEEQEQRTPTVSEAANMTQTDAEPTWFLRIELCGSKENFQAFQEMFKSVGLVEIKKVWGKSEDQLEDNWNKKYGG